MSGTCTVTSALMTCSFGVAPSTLSATPGTVTVEGKPAAVITDIAPGMNIPPFGMCQSLANPTVAAATAAALGVLTPMPCTPTITGPWAPGAPTTTIGGKPALVSGSVCACAWGGVVQLTFTGAVRTTAG
jgi:uncharacterized Zn-binding protein involved in type VI secretion